MSNPTLQLWSDEPVPALLASRNRHTGQIQFPPVDASSPLADDFEPVSLACTGTLYSFTVIHSSPKMAASPRALGYVTLDDCPVRIFGQLRGDGKPSIGDRYRATPDGQFGYVFHTLVEGEK